VRGGSCPAFAANSASPHADEALTVRAHKTGIFYIQVNGWYSSGRYAVKIRRV
jgi:hypothetical protein